METGHSCTCQKFFPLVYWRPYSLWFNRCKVETDRILWSPRYKQAGRDVGITRIPWAFKYSTLAMFRRLQWDTQPSGKGRRMPTTSQADGPFSHGNLTLWLPGSRLSWLSIYMVTKPPHWRSHSHTPRQGACYCCMEIKVSQSIGPTPLHVHLGPFHDCC